MSRAKLIIFGFEVEATEGNANGTLIAWQTDADKRTKARVGCDKVNGQLWERASA